MHPFEQGLIDAGVSQPPTAQTPSNVRYLPTASQSSGSDRYAAAALANECERVACAAEGTRNHTLNSAAYSLGGLVGGGCLDDAQVFDALVAAARTAGLGEDEATKTTRGGMDAGRANPRGVPPRQPQTAAPAFTRAPEMTTGPTANELDNIHRGQARLAYRLEAAYAGKLLHVPGIGWHSWDGTRWRADESGVPTRAVLDVVRRALSDPSADKELVADVRKCESASGIAGVLTIAGALESISAPVAELDADPYLLNTANGTVDLRTKTLHEHAPDNRLTKVCRAAYRHDATAPRWEAFLCRVLPDAEVRGFVQRLAGVALLGRVAEQILPIFTGTGANGKSVFISALAYALGDYAGTAEPDLFMARQGAHPTGEMDLMGRRWVSVSESDKGRKLAEATMKRLTGGDTIRARRMRQDFIEFTPSHTAVLVTNHLPQVSGDDQAIWRRLRVVPFNVVIPPEERDPHLTEALQLEADGILAWAIEGYAEWSTHGLGEPSGVSEATTRYQTSSDDVGRFIEERCHLSQQAYATPTELHVAYQEWARHDGADQMALRAFTATLAERSYKVAKSNGRRLVRGLGLLAAEGDDE